MPAGIMNLGIAELRSLRLHIDGVDGEATGTSAFDGVLDLVFRPPPTFHAPDFVAVVELWILGLLNPPISGCGLSPPVGAIARSDWLLWLLVVDAENSSDATADCVFLAMFGSLPVLACIPSQRIPAR